MLRTLIVLLLALLGAANVATAAVPETPRLRIIGAAQGLPSTDFFGIARDRDGYIWVATGDGLARYDGLAMRVWRHEPDDPRPLPGNNVQFVHVDARDRVWEATENGGLSVLDRARSGFRNSRKAEHPRSAEHTSEHKSLMRISYADFCVTKKTNHKEKYKEQK